MNEFCLLQTEQAREVFGELLQELLKLRSIMIEIHSQGTQNKVEVSSIADRLITLNPTIMTYIEIFQSESSEDWTKNNWINKVTGKSQSQAEPLKINLYLWQVLNFLCINNCSIPEQIFSLLSTLVQIDLKYQNIHSPNSIKNAMIFFHNYLAKAIKEQQLTTQLKTIICMFVSHHFQRDKPKEVDISQPSPKIKKEDHVVQETEWLGYIFMKIFSKEQCELRSTSMLQQLCQSSQEDQIHYYLLHTLNNYFQNMIDQRVTTELVAGYSSPLPDIRQMYNSKEKAFVSICLSEKDLRFTMDLYKEQIKLYKNIFQEHMKAKIQKIDKDEYLNDLKERWKSNADLLTQIGHLLNCLLFIGGYNSQLQDVVIETMLEKNKLLMQYLELSYLINQNLQATFRKSKIEILIEMEKQSKKKLFEAAEIFIEDLNLKDFELQSILAPGQLVLVLRLLNNLVHINHRAQAIFEKDPKYLHMIMSLSHDTATQATMREWSILFIKNVSDNDKLRDEIGKVQMTMKLE